MILAAVTDVFIVLGICLTGYLATRSSWREASTLEIMSLMFPLGAGTLTWLFFVSGWAGLDFDRVPVLISWIAINAILLVIILRQKQHGLGWPKSFYPAGTKSDRLDIVAMALLAIGFLISLWISVGRSYSVYDGIAMWAPKGYGIAMERSLWGARWGGHGYSYPFHIHFLIALFRLLSGDVWPGSKAVFTLLFFSANLGVYAFWLKKKVPPALRLASIVIMMTVPTLFTFSTIGYPNLPMATYLVLAILTGLEGIENGNTGLQVISGMLFGFTAWTVIEGMLYVALVIPGIFAAALIARRVKVRPLAWLGPAFVIWGVWYVFFRLYGAGGSQALITGNLMLDALRSGDWRLTDVRLILGFTRRNLFAVDTWGLVYPVGILISLGGLGFLTPKKSFTGFSLFLVTGITGALSIGLFYLRSFFIEDLYALLERGFPRGFITPTILFFTLAVFIAGQWIRMEAEQDSIHEGSG